MSKLSITLSGVIEKSNFDEWKTELVEQIRSVNTELKTDDDFATATKHVKQFKTAEKNLKEAKNSALKQAEEINLLFEAIDQVSAEARQARLKLDKQIKKRKQEIKDEHIQQGVDTVNAFIKEQSIVFQSLPQGNYNAEAIFAGAVSGKASTKGMQKAISKTCESIKDAITAKAAEVDTNLAVLKKLPDNHQALFQDQSQLVILSTVDLNKTIDERIKNFEKSADSGKSPSDSTTADAANEGQSHVTAAPLDDADTSENTDNSDYLISIEVTSSEQQADDIRSAVVKALSGNSAVGNITLAAK